jgi:hypothetical protein
MDHKFLVSTIDSTICSKCKRVEPMHGPEAVCEACPNVGPVEMFGDMALCRECIAKEMETAIAYQAPELQEARLQAHNATLALARQIDTSVETRTDIFNAATISFDEIRKAIETDENIPQDQKNFKLAETVKERFEHYKKIFFEHNEIAVNAATNQRAAIQYLNTLANKLKAEEREKLQIADMSYKPQAVVSTKVKPIKTVKIKTNTSQADLNKAAKELGLESTHTIQMIMVAKNLDLAGAIAHIQEMKAKNAAK